MSEKFLKSLAQLVLAMSFAGLPAGCVTKSQAQMEARMAYLAGQRDALQQMQQTQQQQVLRGLTVTFVGPVQNPVVNWTEGLTLSQAITTAVYAHPADPALIVVRRAGGEIPIDPKRLLQGEDMPLQAGDIIEFR